MPKLNARIPKYRLHRRSGQAIVSLCGRDHYLGAHNTPDSRDKYDRLITEWITQGRQILQAVDPKASMSVNQLILSFWDHARNYYRKTDGTPTSEVANFKQVLRLLRGLYGNTPAADFGPLKLKAVREKMIQRGWHRKSINKQINRIKHIFSWAVSNEMVPASVSHALTTVKGLARGRTNARESSPVRPVAGEFIEAVKPFVSRQVWALVQLQLLTAARPGELVKLRGIDFQTNAEVWTVEPAHHKNAYRGQSRRIYFGSKAQEIVQTFLDGRSVDACLFSPAEAEHERRQQQHAARKTPASYGNRPGSNRKTHPKRKAEQHYTVSSYCRAIQRGCEAAFPPPPHLARQRVSSRRWETNQEWKARLGGEAWAELKAWKSAHRWHPHQLRHNAATQISTEYGVEQSRIILGHRNLSATEIYAEIDDGKAKEIMKQIG